MRQHEITIIALLTFGLGLAGGLGVSKARHLARERAESSVEPCQDTVEVIGLGFETAKCPGGLCHHRSTGRIIRHVCLERQRFHAQGLSLGCRFFCALSRAAVIHEN